jgi:hypothetical protein
MELAGAGDMDAAPKGERAGASESTAATKPLNTALWQMSIFD